MLPTPIHPMRGRSFGESLAKEGRVHGNTAVAVAAAAMDDEADRKERRVVCGAVTELTFGKGKVSCSSGG